jgi:EthD domain
LTAGRHGGKDAPHAQRSWVQTESSEVVIKQFTFARRADGVPADGFAERWRDQALRANEALPDDQRPWRLAHCVVREGRRPAVHQAVTIEWYDDAAHVPDAAARSAAQNGSLALFDVASLHTVRVEERRVFGEEWLDVLVSEVDACRTPLLLGLIERAPHLSRPEFRDYWWDRHRPLANRLVPAELQPVSYVHNYVAPEDPSPWDGIGEMYDGSLDAARLRAAWFGSEQAAALLEDEQRFLVQSTREVLVTDLEMIIAG